ncbi:hypothetical protein O4H61_19920 [Roseovarius aestuarii]|nr:hypothetical protein [Roseovarius aestuarii]
MMKPLVLTIGLLSIAGCTTMAQREALCQCFNSDGTASGSCDFERLPGQPAVFSFMATAPVSSSPAQSSAALESLRGELCGG